MKILFVFGDAAYVLTHRLSLIKALQAKNYQVMIACPPSPVAVSLQKQGLSIFPLPYFERGGLNPLNDIRASHELWKIIKKIQPTIIHTVAMKAALTGLLATFFTPSLKAPKIVATLGGLGYLFISKSLLVKAIRWHLIKIFNALFKHTHGHLVLQNADDAALLKAAGLRGPQGIHMIPGSGVCPSTYTLIQETKTPATGPRVVYVGRLLKDKGLRELIEAIKILKHRSIKATFHLYGRPDPKNPASLQEADLIDWQAQGLIEWHGHTSTPAQAYERAHIVVLPSYREGLPKSLLEAGLMGKALVATDVPGCREVVLHGHTGLLVPPYKAEPLADNLEKLIKNPTLRHELGMNAYHHVMHHFADPIIHQQHHELYRILLSSSNI